MNNLSTLSATVSLPRLPKTAQQKGVTVGKDGKPHHYTKTSVAEDKKMLMEYLAPYKPQYPFTGPVQVEVIWSWPTKTHARVNTYKPTRPDGDNITKMLLDVLTKLDYWKDDAQVVDLRIIKEWNEKPCLQLWVEELE